MTESATLQGPTGRGSGIRRAGLVDRIVDWANPIVVQELRRGLRTRVFSVAFSLLLVGFVVISLVAFAVHEGSPRSSSGREFFIAYYCCLAIVSFFVLPYNVFRAVSREREEKHWALLVLTRLSPRQILGGKIASALVQALIFGSAAAPFLMFSYLLQGIDLVSVATVFAITIGAQVFLTVAAASAATLAKSAAGKAVVNFLVLAALAQQTFYSMLMIGVALESARPLFSGTDTISAVAVGLWFGVSYSAILFAIGISRLTFDSDNTAVWPRLAMLAQLVGTSVIAFLVAGPKLDRDLPMGFGFVALLQAGWMGIFVSTTPDGLSRRLQRALPRFGFQRLFLPGAVRGFRFFLLFTLCVGGVAAIVTAGSAHARDSDPFFLLTATAFAILYVSLPVILCRGPLFRFLPTAVHQRVFSFFFLGLASSAPPLLAILLGLDPEHPTLNALNPFVVMAGWSDWAAFCEEHFLVLALVSFPAALVADRILSRRDRAAIAQASTEAALG
jgi:hypothetical protein